MSSSPLYLAIVAVWAVVLIPMLLRRDASDTTWIPRRSTAAPDDFADSAPEGRADGDTHDRDDGEEAPERSRREESFAEPPEDADSSASADPEDDTDSDTEYRPRVRAEPEPARRHLPLSRATVIARRRRRTAGLTLLLILTAAAAGAGLGPWWVIAPPAILLLGHLVLLREAAKVDAERRILARRRAKTRRVEARRAEEAREAREAEVIELDSRRKGVYDQYADAHLRAAGD